MKAQDDTPKEIFNDMERYSRLVQFFSSPDKTLSELYPFSPYTSKLPLSECKIPDDALSPTSSGEDFSESDISGTPTSSRNDSPVERPNLYDEPPSRLYLKRRPTRKTQQSGKEDPQHCSEGRQPEPVAAQWSADAAGSRRGRGEGQGRRAGRGQERSERPPSRRRGSGGESSRSSQDGDSPERSRSGGSRKSGGGSSKERVVTGRSGGRPCSSRGGQKRSSPERTSPGGSRRCTRLLERTDPKQQTRLHQPTEQHRSAPTRSNAAEVPRQTTSHESRKTTQRTLELPQVTKEETRSNTSSQKMHTHQRTKDVSRANQPLRYGASCAIGPNGLNNFDETSSKLRHTPTDSRRRCNDVTHAHRKSESNRNPRDTSPGSKSESVSSRVTSDMKRKHAQGTSYQCTTEPTDARSQINPGGPLQLRKFTPASVDTNSPINAKQESSANHNLRLSNASTRASQQKGHSDVIGSPADSKLHSLLHESTRSSAPWVHWSPVGQTVTPHLKLSTREHSRSSAISITETPLQPILGSPVGSSTIFTSTIFPFHPQQSTAQNVEECTFPPATQFYNQINKGSTCQESGKGVHSTLDKSKISITRSSRDQSDQTHLHPTRVEGQARSIATCTTPINSEESIKTDDAKVSLNISPQKPSLYKNSRCCTQENILISAENSDRKFPKSGKKIVPAESNDTGVHNRSLHRNLSWKSTSGSDVTDGDSLLDIEKFKQAVRSVEVPPELLEPLEDTEESENVLNVLETISESPLEESSEVNISSHTATNERVRGDDVVQRNESVNSAGSRANRYQLGTRSGSDLSDIQLHYAYGRNKNDQIELEWIKLEKVVDPAPESSKNSMVDSPFNRQRESIDLQIRSMNLPNASTAPRHGDADRGPIATYLTLPTQSPSSAEDPELAIMVLHEENLSEHQKDVINRFRRGMKRRRSRTSSEMIANVFGSQTSRESVDQPLIVPISDPSTDIGTTGFAVIADSEPEVPLSVDVDVKSWLAKQKPDSQIKSPIVINKRPSNSLFNITNPSYSERRLADEYHKYETNVYQYDSKSPEYYVRRQDSEEQKSDSTSSTIHKRSHSSGRSTSKNNSSKDLVSLERPKTAPPSNDISKFRGVGTHRDQISRDKNILQARRKPRKRTPEDSPSPRQDGMRISGKLDNAPKQTNKNTSTYNELTSAKTRGNERSNSPDSKNERSAINKQDNTVKVLLEPKSKAVRVSKGESNTTQNSNHSRTSDNKTRHSDSETASGRHKRSSSASSRRTDMSSSSYKSKSLERPKTAPAASEENRSQHQRESDPPTKNSKTRGHKRSLSSLGSVFEQRKGKVTEAQVKEKMSSSAAPRAATAPCGGSRKLTGDGCTPKRPQTAPGTVGLEPLGPSISCESTASDDSAGGVPRYRLRRNISYLSEYRKTIESLRAKCAMKDHMIDALVEELKRLAPDEDSLQRLRVKLSRRNLRGPPRRDYSCCEVADLLSRERGDPPTYADPALQPEAAPVGTCVCPTDFRVVGKVGCDCLLLTWKSAPNHDTVAGYEVEVDGQLSQRVRSPARTSALLMDLDLSREMRLSLRTLREGGLAPCHPPLSILFAPSGDEWVLEDPRPALP